MKTWTQLAWAALAAAGLFGLAYAYSVKVGNELVAQVELEELERLWRLEPAQG